MTKQSPHRWRYSTYVLPYMHAYSQHLNLDNHHLQEHLYVRRGLYSGFESKVGRECLDPNTYLGRTAPDVPPQRSCDTCHARHVTYGVGDQYNVTIVRMYVCTISKLKNTEPPIPLDTPDVSRSLTVRLCNKLSLLHRHDRYARVQQIHEPDRRKRQPNIVCKSHDLTITALRCFRTG